MNNAAPSHAEGAAGGKTMAYDACIRCGWKTGIHDCRPFGYEHPWLVIHRPSKSAVGCYSKKEARIVLRALKTAPPTGRE